MINMTMDMSDNRPLGWTTLEEAKQLIEAGLDKNTADMWISPKGIYIGRKETPIKYETFPCWSLGVLTQLLPRTIEQEYNLLINSEFYVMYRHPFSKDVKFVCSKSSFLIENVKDAIIWLLNNKFYE